MVGVPTKWKVVIFDHGKRLEKWYDGDPIKAQTIVKQLNHKDGVKAHLVSRVTAYPPKGVPETATQMWCPYCRRWRYFGVPRYRPSAEYGTLQWMLNVVSINEIRACQWCTITEQDFWVRRYNYSAPPRKRLSRKRRKKKVRPRRG